MSDHRFWLSESQFERIQPFLPNKPRGVPRVDDRRVVSGIIHVIRNGLMWRDAPERCGPHKTLCNRSIRWSEAGVFDHVFAELAAESTATDTVMIPSRRNCVSPAGQWTQPTSRLIARRRASSRRGSIPLYRAHQGWFEFKTPRCL